MSICRTFVLTFSLNRVSKPLPIIKDIRLVEETKDLAGDVLPPGLLVVHDASGGGEDDVTELTGRKELDDPLLDVLELDVVAGGDDTGLVDTAKELDDDLAVAVVVDFLELADVALKIACQYGTRTAHCCEEESMLRQIKDCGELIVPTICKIIVMFDIPST